MIGKARHVVQRGPQQAFDDYLVLLAQGGSREAFARHKAEERLAYQARVDGPGKPIGHTLHACQFALAATCV